MWSVPEHVEGMRSIHPFRRRLTILIRGALVSIPKGVNTVFVEEVFTRSFAKAPNSLKLVASWHS